MAVTTDSIHPEPSADVPADDNGPDEIFRLMAARRLAAWYGLADND